MKLHSKTAAALALSCLLLGGCKFSATASGSIKSSGDANAEAQASVEPQPAAPAEPDAQAITFREGRLDYEGVINFEYDKAELKKDAETQNTLAEFKKFLEAHPNVDIQVEGHTDSRGSDDYNRDLSDRRAASVRRWLLDNGIAEERVTSVGRGEDQPQIAEPDECNDREPADTSTCEGPWAANRRVVFRVTRGAETLPEKPEPAPEPAPAPETASATPPSESCPWLWGGHLDALGPNSWVMVAGATQPGVCWLELGLGAGLGWGDRNAEITGASADGNYFSLTVPLRGRFWFMNTHSLIADLGFGFTHYRISADLDDGTSSGDYRRRTTPLIAHLGVGYGFRGNGAQAGPRLALIVGALAHLTELGASEVDAPAAFTNAAALQAALDDETDELADLEPYGEISFGWLF